MMSKLPEKWLSPKKAKAAHKDAEAWWYGEENGIHVCIADTPPGSIPQARIPKDMILKWADDIRKVKP